MSGSGSEKAITIVVADDHALVRSALRTLLENQADFMIVGEAADLSSASAEVISTQARVLILDVNMPDGLAVEVLPELRDRAARTEIVLLTMERNLALARRAIDAGARGYLFKDAAHRELIEAVRSAAAGRAYLSAELAASLRDEKTEHEDSPLSERESETLRLMALGHTNREIASKLSLSVRTVETHRAHIQQKLGLSSRPELTLYALAHDLIDGDPRQ